MPLGSLYGPFADLTEKCVRVEVLFHGQFNHQCALPEFLSLPSRAIAIDRLMPSMECKERELLRHVINLATCEFSIVVQELLTPVFLSPLLHLRSLGISRNPSSSSSSASFLSTRVVSLEYEDSDDESDADGETSEEDKHEEESAEEEEQEQEEEQEEQEEQEEEEGDDGRVRVVAST
ncbi:hypothetical protein C8J57DRAFT_1243051 [Mycena rebaudengoi]|nr:hypothetical protein C8J57DRAFT_1243051 [Mycena rebaudengoi]